MRSRYRFRAGLAPTLVALAVLPVLLGLGFWQLDRASQKRATEARLQDAAEAEPRRLSLPLPEAEALRLEPVKARGRYDGRHQFLLANQVREGTSGYLVLTPFRLAGSSTAFLVARDWVAADGDRSQLPELPPVPEGRGFVAGLITEGPSVGYRMGEAYVGDGDWPRRVTYLDFNAMGQAVPYQLAPFVLEPNTEPAQRKERLTGGISPQRHVGYAFQWFGLGAALVVIYLVVNLRRENDDEP